MVRVTGDHWVNRCMDSSKKREREEKDPEPGKEFRYGTFVFKPEAVDEFCTNVIGEWTCQMWDARVRLCQKDVKGWSVSVSNSTIMAKNSYLTTSTAAIQWALRVLG
jgi:hypothetical protein